VIAPSLQRNPVDASTPDAPNRINLMCKHKQLAHFMEHPEEIRTRQTAK
jgi:hypothetical protein